MTLSKTKSSITLFLLIALITFSFKSFAQDTDYGLIKEKLTVQQREMLQEELKLMKQNRAELKATLTEEQKALLQNKEMTQEQIRKQLKASFSEEQLQLVERQENRLRLMRQNFQNTLTEEQKLMLQERVQARVKNSGEQSELRNGTRTNSNGTRGNTNGGHN